MANMLNKETAAQQQPPFYGLGLGANGILGRQARDLKTISESDYNTEKHQYSKFKTCENPIKQSEYTWNKK